MCGILDNFVVALWEGILGGTLVQRYPDIDLNSAAPPTLGLLSMARHTTGQRATSVAFQLLSALIQISWSPVYICFEQ